LKAKRDLRSGENKLRVYHELYSRLPIRKSASPLNLAVAQPGLQPADAGAGVVAGALRVRSRRPLRLPS
ncbi:hypothetical protein, partial [Streptomyces sp. NPDC006324]|uniref:hypothetical protein n=1 Tax=Streptomyces sp. NPDC006324 TaxID=3156751 RepID=UPI0033A58B8A